MPSALSACRVLVGSGRILLEEVIWWLNGATQRPVARSLVYVHVDPRAEWIRIRAGLGTKETPMTHCSEGVMRCL
jgi:hypothetical protein